MKKKEVEEGDKKEKELCVAPYRCMALKNLPTVTETLAGDSQFVFYPLFLAGGAKFS